MGNKIKYLGLLLALCIISCDDIIEEDITDDDVQTIYPTEAAVITSNVTPFSWRALDGADDYRIQISDALTSVIILDSLVSTTMYEYPLDPGSYQWRVKGENFAYETPYTFPIAFTVEASTNLTDQSVLLASPSSNLYTNTTDFLFTWNSLTFADSYTFQLLKSLGGSTVIYNQPDITLTNHSVDAALFDEDAEYIWQVKAVNTTSETAYASRSIFLDTQDPNVPVLVSPIEDEVLSTGTIDLTWTLASDTGSVQSPITTIVEIAQDDAFSVILETISVNDVEVLSLSFTSVGDYYWRIKTEDAAGNSSEYSASRKFTLN